MLFRSLDTNLVLGIDAPEIDLDTTLQLLEPDSLMFEAGLSGADTLTTPESILVSPDPH